MALIKKCDVKSYFAARRLNGKQIGITAPGPGDATGFCGRDANLIEAKALEFKQDFIADHSRREGLALPMIKRERAASKGSANIPA